MYESVVMGMVYGYFLVIGKMVVVMVYINVGLVNCVIGVINVVVEYIFMLLFFG